ncbi:MAG: hypothetical protein H7A18_07170 [Sinobacteraceae bacterium]|nr:hypothetical protein [Nevskiaceae bacterium]
MAVCLACRSRADSRRHAILAACCGLLWLAIATTTRAAEPSPLASPLIDWTNALQAGVMLDETARRADLRRAETRLARVAAPRDGCAEALGAQRYADLHVELARARDALGDRRGAEAAWHAVLDCTPRNATAQLALARLSMLAGESAAARARLARALELAPQFERSRQLGIRLDYLAGRWTEAASGAAELAAEHRNTAGHLSPSASKADDTEDGEPSGVRLSAAYWDLLALLARRRGGLPPTTTGDEPDPALGNFWPAPLWEHLLGLRDEASLVEAMETAATNPRQRREMACEALYYTAQLALAEGHSEDGRQRLARVVNLKVLYFVEHDLALAELAGQRAAGAAF